MRFDVIDGKMVIVGLRILLLLLLLLLFVIRNANQSGIEMTGVSDSTEEERVGGLILRKPGRFELRKCRVMTEIVVLTDLSAATLC
jgi:hypothetical protein